MKREQKVLLRLGICLLVLSLMFTASTSGSTAIFFPSTTEADYPMIIVNDDILNFNGNSPEMINDVAYAPIRTLMNALGVQVVWHEEANAINIFSSVDNVLVKLDDKNAISLITRKTFPAEIFMYNDLCYGSIRSLAEHFGYTVDYIENSIYTPIIRIYKKQEIKLMDSEMLDKYHSQLVDYYNEIYNKIVENRKVAFLTFDDGPGQYTSQIISLLDSYGFKGTFFMLSPYMKTYPDIVRQMANKGHTPALHGSTHFKNQFYKNDFSVRNSMDTANNVLSSIIGRGSLICRVPYGSVPNMTKNQWANLKEGGYKLWDWNIDSGDSNSQSVTADYIINTTIKGLKRHKESIIIFHEKEVTVRALPAILKYIKDNNILVKPLSDYMPGKSFIANNF